jgi:hypothetical protein
MIFATSSLSSATMTEFGAMIAQCDPMRHKTTQTVFDHFNRIRDGNPAPLRADIHPEELKSALPDIFILDMDRHGNFVFRLAGTRVCTILGRELRGEQFVALWHAPHRHRMKLAAEAVLANQAPMTVRVRSIADEENDGDLEMLLMPLSSRPGIVDRLYGCLADLSHPPLLTERNRILWAEGVNFVAPDTIATPPLATGGAFTIVTGPAPSFREGMKHLRVLEGGRKD